MKRFNEMGIQPERKGFTGEKIEVHNILNEEITIHDYKIETSKFTDKGNGRCLHLQIEINGARRVVFTGSGSLMETIEKVGEDDFPFMTIIKKNNKRFEFT